ncbi:hypothetical protein N7539_003707 [Penicillium diatomitis]|uniref:Ubiquitin-like protease family profile domain-containing protein n=1 Tax=Penicillium diatomitis TaxID=2819901 RepID=A0A9X0BY40_9EURO|nr:uncharacterized protein N7539_003707 [Penicillium diatomitis]KAJ5488817.1 hypothetical protein N7539_003707 [Penicillium diatomitis]
MKRFLAWVRGRPDPGSVTTDTVSPNNSELVDNRASSRQTRRSQVDDIDLHVPGAFPPSPTVLPQLATHDNNLEERNILGVTSTAPTVDTEIDIGIDVSKLTPLHTDLGPHLHPRRARPSTPPAHSTRRPESARSKPIRKPRFRDDSAIEDPYGQQYKAFEKGLFRSPVSAVTLVYPETKPLPSNRAESLFKREWEQREKEKKALQALDGRPARVIPRGPAVRPLSREWHMKVSEAMRTLQGYAVARSPSGDDLFQRDIATCLKPLAWLNDEMINAYLSVLVQYLRDSTGNSAPGEKPKFHAFNTFFFSTLKEKGYEGVRRWAKRAKIGGEGLLEVDTVFIPVHQASHWTLMVVRPSDRTIEYYDSLGARGAREVEIIKKWLQGELGLKFEAEEWTFLSSVSSQQDNMSDCGVFLLINAKAIALGIEPTAFGPKDTVTLRAKIVAELMNGGLHGAFAPVDKKGQILL